MKSKNIKYAAAIASLAMVASSQATITTIATDGFNTGAISDNWGATTTTTAGQWSISQTTAESGRTLAGDPFGYGGQPAAPQEGTGQVQFSNGFDGTAHTATITDTANHYFNAGDQVAIDFFTAKRTDGNDDGPLGLTVSLVGADTYSYGTYTPTDSTWTQSTTNSFTILTAGNYNVQFASVGEVGDRTSYLDSVSYKVEPIPEPPTITTDGFNTGAISDNWGETTTTTAGQWSISQTTAESGRTVAGDPFGYGGQPAAPQEGTGQVQISNGYDGTAHTATITDTANHYFYVGDQVAIDFFTAKRADGADDGALGLTVSLVGADTFSYGTYTPTANTWTQSRTSSFTILIEGNYNVQFVSAGEDGDRTSYLDSVSYKVSGPSTGAYSDWAVAKGLTGPAAAFDADPDGDGIANGLEFVLGGEPNPANANWNSLGLLPTAQASGNDLVFTFQRNKEAAYLNPTAEFSANLVPPWTTAVHGTNATITVIDAGTSETITVTIPKNGSTALFARLKVIEPAP